MMAADQGCATLVQTLIESGAALDLQSDSGHTAWALARRSVDLLTASAGDGHAASALALEVT